MHLHDCKSILSVLAQGDALVSHRAITLSRERGACCASSHNTVEYSFVLAQGDASLAVLLLL